MRKPKMTDLDFEYTKIDSQHGLMSITFRPTGDVFIRDLKIRCFDGEYRPASVEDHLYENNYGYEKKDIIMQIRYNKWE